MSLSTGRRRALYLAVGMLSVLILPGACSFLRGPSVPGPRALAQSFSHGGRDRSYQLYRPASLAAGAHPGLILALHGAGGTGRGMEGLALGQLNRVADRDGLIVAYPDGVKKRWNDGRSGEDATVDTTVDDEGFLIALVDDLSRRFSIDPTRVYVTGASNGGFMAFRLACTHPDKLAAIAPVMSGLGSSVAETCAESKPDAPAVSLLMINGTEDPLVPFDGVEVKFRDKHLGAKLTVPATISRWSTWLGCTQPPTKSDLADVDPSDRTRVSLSQQLVCRDQSEVTLVTIEGGGHTWPGGHPYLPERTIGRTSRDVDASELIGAFFSRHRRAPVTARTQ